MKNARGASTMQLAASCHRRSDVVKPLREPRPVAR